QKAKQAPPIYDFSTTDMFRHTLWAVEDAEDQASLKHIFAQKKNFYIADGHHRCASSARLTEQLNDGEYGTEAPHDFFMSYLVPASQMHIEAFHRVLKLNGEVDKDEILQSLGQTFDIAVLDAMALPNGHGEMCMSIQGASFRLKAKGLETEKLDVELCSEKILEPIFDIVDLRNDRRISFLSGNDGLKGIDKTLSTEGVDVLIALYPTQVKEIFDVADRGESMPPKSTWVEPKLRSALTMYSLTKH
ncbi:MAG: DUF1015 domain-containing protein, partial [Flavobacteriales bacterium]|nr:DUF1015 domain-containing protein [Flavobacteriales bacterium]